MLENLCLFIRSLDFFCFFFLSGKKRKWRLTFSQLRFRIPSVIVWINKVWIINEYIFLPRFKKSYLKHKLINMQIILTSTITCLQCSHQAQEEMPTDACWYFYECEQCHTKLKPLSGDCCVFCSYGSVPCPPIQQGKNCCK